jgi:hypothetical protein
MTNSGRSIRLWLDDVRPAPEGWMLVKTVEEAIEVLVAEDVEEISLDNDLGGFEREGREVCVWMEANGVWPAIVHLHTSNNPASTYMRAILVRHGYVSEPGALRTYRRADGVEPGDIA